MPTRDVTETLDDSRLFKWD